MYPHLQTSFHSNHLKNIQYIKEGQYLSDLADQLSFKPPQKLQWYDSIASLAKQLADQLSFKPPQKHIFKNQTEGGSVLADQLSFKPPQKHGVISDEDLAHIKLADQLSFKPPQKRKSRFKSDNR